MQHIDNIYDLPNLRYMDVRANINSADIMLCKGTQWISKGIQRWTKSPWSHVGLILWTNDRIVVVESVDHGVRAITLSSLIRQNPSEIVVCRCNWVNSERAIEIAKSAIDYLGIPYDWHHILEIMWRITWGKGRKLDNNKFICSELVAECFDDAGYSFQYDKRGFVTPENIWCDNSMEVIGRLM